MITLAIVFLTTIVAGYFFWIYNRRQVQTLTEKIDDKDVIISSLQDHVSNTEYKPKPSVVVETKIITPDANDEWRGGQSNQTQQQPTKKKQRYSNRPKKNGAKTEQNVSQNNGQKQGRPKKQKSAK